jgi:hypothetical protein
MFEAGWKERRLGQKCQMGSYILNTGGEQQVL